MMVDFNMAEADKFCKDGQVDVKEFFARQLRSNSSLAAHTAFGRTCALALSSLTSLSLAGVLHRLHSGGGRPCVYDARLG
eukprot:5338680-Prymnesium_polylepis.1